MKTKIHLKCLITLMVFNTEILHNFWALISDDSYSYLISILLSSILVYSNYENFLISLIAIELNLLFINLSFIETSLFLDDIYGQVFSFFILTIAASESSIGLAIIILYFRVKKNILVPQKIIWAQRF